MKKIIVDTSVTVKLFLEEEGSDLAEKVFEQAKNGEILLFAPTLTSYEVLNTLVKENISNDEIQEHLLMLKDYTEAKILNIVDYSETLALKILEIATMDTKGKGHISSYDATFHALAILQQGIFLTADKKHYEKTKELIGFVVLLNDFFSVQNNFL
jgi:predicted nucleic acid-binding protein